MPSAVKRTLGRVTRDSPLPDELLTQLALVPPIFAQAQHNISNHRKNVVALRKIQERCAAVTEQGPKGTMLLGEKGFNSKFIDCVDRVLAVKKGVAVADRVVGFVGKFAAYTSEQDEENTSTEGPSSRFTTKLLKHLLSGSTAKDKSVRYRIVQILTTLLSSLGEIDDDLYEPLRTTFLERAHDKEPAIRVQAVLGLAKLMGGEDEDELEEDEQSLKEVVLGLMRFDPAAEVRRAALYNLPLQPETITPILSRSRDIDPVLRKSLYTTVLGSKAIPDMRVLTIHQREGLIKNGLGDRETGVRNAAAGMVNGWLGEPANEEEALNTVDRIVQFLERFDLVSGQIAEDALNSLFTTRRELLDDIEFNEAFWNELTPERAFLARVFVDHCLVAKDEARLERVLPVVTTLAFKIQDEYNQLVNLLPEEILQPGGVLAGDLDEIEDLPEGIMAKAFVVSELSKLAVGLDYADEIGRRKMFQLACEMISQPSLPESMIPLCMNILSRISESERDLIRVIVDVVTEIRLGEEDGRERGMSMMPDDDSMSVTTSVRSYTQRRRQSILGKAEDPAARLEAAVVDMRCLLVCASLLERVNGTLRDNAVFEGLVTDLIVPSIRNKEEPALREQGLICLGLCCMIEVRMAKESFVLFMQQLNAGDDELRTKTAQILFDLLMVHDIGVLVQDLMPVEQVIGLIRHILALNVPGLQAVAAEGSAKLMLSNMIYDAGLLQQMIVLYLSPETSTNLPLRQCLSYFFPVYCYSSPLNQRRMQEVAMPTIELLASQADELTIPLSQMALLLVDWTDPSKAVEREGAISDEKIHFYLAQDLLQLVAQRGNRELRKTVVALLSKLYLPDQVDELQVKGMVLLIRNIAERRPLQDAASRNSLGRFEKSLLKRYPEQVENIDEEALRDAEGLAPIWSVIDALSDVDDDDETASQAPTETRAPARKTGRSKKPASSDEDSDSEELDMIESEVPAAPSRRNPERKSVRRKQVVEDEESEAESEEAGESEEDE